MGLKNLLSNTSKEKLILRVEYQFISVEGIKTLSHDVFSMTPGTFQ